MNNWKKYKLEDLVDAERGISYGIVQPGEFLKEGGVPVLKVNNLTERKVDVRDVYRVTADVERKFSRTRLRGNELLVSVVGSLGHIHKVTQNEVGWNVVRAIAVLPIKKQFNRDWIYWCLRSPEIQIAFENAATVTVQATLNIKELKVIEIPFPDEATQDKIASILSSLDDKIELNRQTNATLEAMAQALFKEWFVDFRFPGASGEMEESEGMMVPKGWRVGKLGDVCQNIRKSIQPRDLDSEVPYLGLEHIQRKNLSIPEWGISSEVDSQKFRFEREDILFGKLRPYFHKVGLAPVAGICSTDILVIRPLEEFQRAFAICHLFSDSLIAFVSAIADGTRMPRVDWKSIANYTIVVPPKNLLKDFNSATEPILERMLETTTENQTLTQLRDSLLPKLMRGDFTVEVTK